MHTLQFDAQTEQALIHQAALVGKDADQLIKDVVSAFLAGQAEYRDLLEDVEDLATLAERRNEACDSHDNLIARLKADGLL